MRKNYLIIVSLVIIAALVSCSDDNGDFNIGLYASGSYGVQLSDTEFKPVVVFTSTFTTISSSQSSLTQNGDRIDGKSFTDHTYEATVVYPSLERMSGTYIMNAVTTYGEEEVSSTALSFDKPLGDVEFHDFDYNENGQLVMRIHAPIEEATHYGFLIDYSSQSGSWAQNVVISVKSAATEYDQTITHAFDSSTLTASEALVYPIAIRNPENYSRFVKMGNPKKLKKGSDSFE